MIEGIQLTMVMPLRKRIVSFVAVSAVLGVCCARVQEHAISRSVVIRMQKMLASTKVVFMPNVVTLIQVPKTTLALQASAFIGDELRIEKGLKKIFLTSVVDCNPLSFILGVMRKRIFTAVFSFVLNKGMLFPSLFCFCSRNKLASRTPD